ncbi:hypothetical protein BDQ12DRAFT_669229 [Crucibulum laeve]|uniref:Uncharacterized protein n=1 Tax=Crucibulum laeve TaxID=68775 RepID=A0A5C3LNA4_9AGAR|nr:hypothetical protein BDQ12DRAFT_669229 [Crucibulum laeve]
MVHLPDANPLAFNLLGALLPERISNETKLRIEVEYSTDKRAFMSKTFAELEEYEVAILANCIHFSDIFNVAGDDEDGKAFLQTVQCGNMSVPPIAHWVPRTFPKKICHKILALPNVPFHKFMVIISIANFWFSGQRNTYSARMR